MSGNACGHKNLNRIDIQLIIHKARFAAKK